MHLPIRLPHLTAVLLLAATPSFSAAESPMPEPIAPAVIGRPLDQIRPVRPARPKPVAKKVERPKPAVASKKQAPKRTAARPAAAPAVASIVPAPLPAQPVAVQRVEPRTVAAVRQAPRIVTRQFGPGNYFGNGDKKLVHDYYATHPLSKPVASWKVGEPIPPKAALTGVPDGLRTALPALPPGHQYVQVDGEVVLVAVQSRTVVDGISRAGR